MARTRAQSSTRVESAGLGVSYAARIASAIKHATPMQKALLMAGGVVAVGTAPLWAPALVRSKVLRGVVVSGAKMAMHALPV